MKFESILLQKPSAIDLSCWKRIQLKALLLSGLVDFTHYTQPVEKPSVFASECDEPGEMAERLARIEQKLDKLLQIRLREDVPPLWFRTSEERLLTAIADVAKSCTQVVTSRDLLRHDLEKMAEGADRFLAGIKAKLTKAQGDLFFEMIATVQEGCVQRVQSYGDIGAKMGITKQAIQKRYKKLCEAHPSVAAYIDSIRNPQKSSNFSEISPTERRKRGVDDSYGYDAH